LEIHTISRLFSFMCMQLFAISRMNRIKEA